MQSCKLFCEYYNCAFFLYVINSLYLFSFASNQWVNVITKLIEFLYILCIVSLEDVFAVISCVF